MAQFLKFGPVEAGDISSGTATDGQVLTADGAGAAAWQDAAPTATGLAAKATLETRGWTVLVDGGE